MRPQVFAFLASLLVAPCAAVFADDAYSTDYHHALVGAPQQDTTFFQQPSANTKASLLYTLSSRSILAAVNPKDGSLVWRQLLSTATNETVTHLRSGLGQDTVVTGAGNQVAAWNALDGRLEWANDLGLKAVKDLEILELDDEQPGKDVVVLVDGDKPSVKRIDGTTGAIKWEHEDNSGDIPFQVTTSATAIYYISLHSTLLGGGLKVKVAPLELSTGRKLDQITLSSDSDITSVDSILFVGANSASPLLVWTDKARKTIKVNILGKKSVASFNIENKAEDDIVQLTVHAPHRIESLTHFLVHYQTSTSHWAEVYHVDLARNSVTKAYSLPKLAGKGAFATSTTNANVYFTRITESEVTVVSSASHGVLGRFPLKVDTLSRKVFQPVHGVSEVVVREGSAQAVRVALLDIEGRWLLIRNGDVAWTRPEMLADVITAAWADLPEEETLVHELEIEGHENVFSAYAHRVRRHIHDLQYLPAWLENVPKRIIGSLVGKTSADDSDGLTKDTYGFQKLVVLVTKHGHLVGLSAGQSGKPLWSTDLSTISPDFEIDTSILRSATNGLVELRAKGLTRPILVNATTGAIPQGPSTSLHAVTTGLVVVYKVVDGEIKAFIGGEEQNLPAWNFAPAPGERIINVVARPEEDPVASIGKVLGDRRVLYKYLNPNLVLITIAVDALNQASFYLLDSVSGNVLYAASHENVDTSRVISSTISENWFAYSFSTGNSSRYPSRGYQLTVSELYESTIPNDRGPFGASSNVSSIQPTADSGDAKPSVISQTFQIAEEISHMAVTHTKQGITSRQLLVVLPESNSIVGIPRQALDPRRPVGRDPTPDEASEGLVRYLPSLEFDPKWYLNHKREVVGISKIITSPALLESTSLVFAYGLDIFGTRVSPSFSFDVLGKDFNKLQMLGTVAALFIGVLFVAPLVRRKQINAGWHTSI